MMGVLHRDGSRLKAELRGELFNLYRVIIRQQDLTFYLAEQAEQLSMVNLPVRVESSCGLGIRWIDKKDSLLIVHISFYQLQAVTVRKAEAVSMFRYFADASRQSFWIPSRT